MRRRGFITGLGNAAAWSAGAMGGAAAATAVGGILGGLLGGSDNKGT
jgi:hypothetical protein